MARRPKRGLSSAAYTGIVGSLIPTLSMRRIVADKQYQGGYTLDPPYRHPLPCVVLQVIVRFALVSFQMHASVGHCPVDGRVSKPCRHDLPLAYGHRGETAGHV